MPLRFHDGDTQVHALIGARSVYAAQPQIDALRQRTGQVDDILTSMQRFVPWTSMAHEIPGALLMHRSGELYGVALLSFRQQYGVPVGLVKAGNLGGQGGVIAAASGRIAVMETASRVLLNNALAHTVVLSTLWTDLAVPGPNVPVPGVQGEWHFREVRLRLDLSGGLEATMGRWSQRMRRNLRYYRRRAEAEFGCRFLPDMTAEQRWNAVAALFDKGRYPTEAKRAWRLEGALQETPGQFAMGLQAASGDWLSYIAGWRGADGSYIEWQLNSDHHEHVSVSTVMRSYLLEHEVGRQSPAIIFVGETAAFWSRVCEPSVCGDLLATRKGIVGSLARRLICRISPTGQVAKLHARATSAVG